MATKIKNKIFSSIYFKVSALMIVFFFIASWYINSRMETKMTQRTNELTENIAFNSIHVATSILDNYEEKLSLLKIMLTQSKSRERAYEPIAHIKKEDTSINDIYLEEINSLPRDSIHIWRSIVSKEGKSFMKFSTPINPKIKLSLLVDLIDFHQKISETDTKEFKSYLTIAWQGFFLYHPDEKKIGAQVGKQDLFYEKRMQTSTKYLIEKVKSDYLETDVYRYYKLIDIDGKSWMFTASIPNLQLIESGKKIANSFLVISLLAIISFLAVFSLGILKWRKELIRRKEIEQENLNLELRNEQHKQTMIATELENLKSGLNPHFLFNSLSSLGALISKEPNIAKDFTITLSNLYRYMLRQESQNVVSLQEELEFTKNYISLQKIRFANKIIVEISLSEKLMSHKIPPISLQLLVENCIKHTKISANTPLTIHIYEDQNFIVVTNNYNPRELETEYSGKGIENLIKRYSFLTNTNCNFGIVNEYYIARIPML